MIVISLMETTKLNLENTKRCYYFIRGIERRNNYVCRCYNGHMVYGVYWSLLGNCVLKYRLCICTHVFQYERDAYLLYCSINK